MRQNSNSGAQIVSKLPPLRDGHRLRCALICAKGCVMLKSAAKFHLGQVVRHRKHSFRGVVFDVDALFSNTEEWYRQIPEDSRPARDQPFYHLLAENGKTYYVAYVSEQNLLADDAGGPVDHPDLPDLFGDFENGRYPLQFQLN
jgi:heat shock protein HspQ